VIGRVLGETKVLYYAVGVSRKPDARSKECLRATGLVRASRQVRKVRKLTAKMTKREMTTNDESLAFPNDNFTRQQHQQNSNIPALPL
jgi:hypothetical protein